jgi:hypothetical protein
LRDRICSCLAKHLWPGRDCYVFGLFGWGDVEGGLDNTFNMRRLRNRRIRRHLFRSRRFRRSAEQFDGRKQGNVERFSIKVRRAFSGSRSTNRRIRFLALRGWSDWRGRWGDVDSLVAAAGNMGLSQTPGPHASSSWLRTSIVQEVCAGVSGDLSKRSRSRMSERIRRSLPLQVRPRVT